MVKEQTLTYTLKLLLEKAEDPDAEIKLLITMDSFAQACDFASETAQEFGEENPVSLQSILYHIVRKQFVLPAQIACNVFRTVSAHIKALRTREKHTGKMGSFPRYRKGFCVYTKDRDYGVAEDHVSLNTFCGRIKIPFRCSELAKKAMESGKIGGAKLRCRNGKFLLDVSVTTEINVPDVNSHARIVGVDSGINKILAASGEHKDIIVDGGRIKNARARYKALRKELQKLGTPAARRKIRKIGSRENGYVRDVLHCVSKALVGSYPEGTIFCFEDLSGMRKVTEKVRIRDRYLYVSWPYAELINLVAYKARKSHQEVMLVTPDYTSQRCPVCGSIEKSNRDRARHAFKCRNCGYSSNDDRVGAVNLRRKGEFTIQVFKELGVKNLDGMPKSISDSKARAAMKTSMAGFPAMGADVNRPERSISRFFSIRRQHGRGRVELSPESEGRGGESSGSTSGQSQASSFMAA